MVDIEYRIGGRDVIDRVEEIDRSEVIEAIYYRRDGQLVLDKEHWELKGWPSRELPQNTLYLSALLDRGGAIWGAFDGDRLVGMAALDSKWIGPSGDTLDLYFLHVSAGYRDRGVGTALVDLVKERAREMGARRLYVSATPSEHTVRFYKGVGFDLARHVDPELFELEPDDIHMDMDL